MALVPLGRSFNGLWTATGTANLADGVALFSLPLLALATGASPGGVAAVATSLTLAWPVFGLHAGWIVDRLDRRRLLIGVNVLRATVLAALTVGFATERLSLALILAAALLLGAAETLADTGLTSTVPLVVEPHQRARANARIEATINLTNQMAGPPLAGLLAGATLALTTGASALLYALAVACLATLVLRRPAAMPRAIPAFPPTHRGLAGGLTFLWRQPVLRTITLFTAAMNLVWAAALALLVVYAVAPGPLGLTPAQYGLTLTAMAAGGLAAAAVLERLRQRFGVTTLMIADCIGTVLLVAPAAVGAGTWAVVAGVAVAGAGSSIWRILVATIRQNLAPPELLGRVYAASRVLSWGVLPVGAALAGVGAEVWGVRAVFAAATVVAVAALLAFVVFAVRADLSAAIEPQSTPVPE